jgi:leader peptidase (prepilin peptidase) / N-methyltransferase
MSHLDPKDGRMSTQTMWTISAWACVGAALGTIIHHISPRPSTQVRLSGASAGPATSKVTSMWTTAVLFGLLAARLGRDHELLAVSTLALVGVPLAAMDLAEHRLPTALITPLYPTVLGHLGLTAMVDHRYADLLRAAAGMLVLPAGYLTLALATRGGIGAGDIRLAGPIGLTLAWHSWTTLATGTLLAFVYASLATTMITIGRAATPASVPFGPAMLGGALTTILVPGTS